MADLSGAFKSASEEGLRSFASVDALVLRRANEFGSDPSEALDYYAASVYMRVFAEWENFVENAATIGLTGRAPRAVRESYVPRLPNAPDISTAFEVLAEGSEYLLWHSAISASKRLRRHYSKCILSDVLDQYQDELMWYSTIRHAIAHRSADAIRKFETSARSRMVRGYRQGPGRILRSTGGGGGLPLNDIVRRLNELAEIVWPQEKQLHR
jgi:hypothetical protein